MFLRICAVCFVFFAGATIYAETYFECLNNENTSLFGTITELNRNHVVFNGQDGQYTIPLGKVVKIRNLLPSPYGEAAVNNRPHSASRSPLAARRANERKLAEFLVSVQRADAKGNEQFARKNFPGHVIVLDLKDGGSLTVSSLTISGGQAVVRLLEQSNNVSIPLHKLSSVRLTVRSLSDVFMPPEDWLRLSVPHTDGDRLVVGNPGAFDVYSGIFGDVDNDTVQFDVDGEVLPIPRRRVFGLVFHAVTEGGASSMQPAVAPALGTLTLWTGTQGIFSDIDMKDSELTWQTPSGVSFTTTLDMVNEIDFGQQGVGYLFDFERKRSEFTLPIELHHKSQTNESQTGLEHLQFLQTFYEGRTNDKREIVMDGVAYNRDSAGRAITLQGRTLLEYHLPDPSGQPYVSLSAIIGIEDQFRPNAASVFRLLADSQVLGEWVLRGDAAAQSIQLSLPLDCRVITIFSEPVVSLGMPTVLTIAEPKLFE